MGSQIHKFSGIGCEGSATALLLAQRMECKGGAPVSGFRAGSGRKPETRDRVMHEMRVLVEVFAVAGGLDHVKLGALSSKELSEHDPVGGGCVPQPRPQQSLLGQRDVV